jgi:TPR repeat protein
MNEKSPVTAYFDACKLQLEIQEIDDFSEQLKRMRALRAIWQTCIQQLLAVADSPDPQVWYALGDAFSSGRGTQFDRPEAIRWFQRAAEVGHLRAMFSLGICLKHPDTPDTHTAAVQWFRKAAELGDAGGMVFLGFAYRDGTGVPCDYPEAIRWFIKAVEAGDLHSMIYVGRMYSSYLPSPAEAVRWFLKAAEAGFSESYVPLAMHYDDRKSPVYDPVAASKWYHVVADHSEGSNAHALLALARHYRDGTGVPRDPEMAKLWLRRLLRAVPEKSADYRAAPTLLNDIEGQLL